MKKNNKGFTLVELIVVLVILAILASILVPSLVGYITRTRHQKDFTTAQTVRVAAQTVLDQAYSDGCKYYTPDQHNVTKLSDMTDYMRGSNTTYKTSGNKYEAMVYELAGVDPEKVTEFWFHYVNGVITEGNVTINGQKYDLDTNGNWSAS